MRNTNTPTRRALWLGAAALVIVLGLSRFGSCTDSASTGASSCTSHNALASPVGVLLVVAGVAFVAFAIRRSTITNGPKARD